MTSMPTTDRPGIGVGLPLILALVFANLLGGPLRTFRPPVPEAEAVSVDAEEAVPARLWRDPLEAGYDHVRLVAAQDPDLPAELRRTEPVDGASLGGEIARRLGNGDGEPPAEITVMPVLVPGGTRAERHELRVRRRYAVVAALTHDGAGPGACSGETCNAACCGAECGRGACGEAPCCAEEGGCPSLGPLQAVDPEHVGLARFTRPRPEPVPRPEEVPEAGPSGILTAATSLIRAIAGPAPMEASAPVDVERSDEVGEPGSGTADGAIADDSGERSTLLVPFEWFESSETRRAALVLWVDELAIQGRPLHWLADVVHVLREATEEATGTRTAPSAALAAASPAERREPPFRVSIVGPTDSNVLLRMLDDDEHWPPAASDWAGPGHREALADARLVSPRSTLSTHDGHSLDDPGWTPFRPERSGLAFERTIGTDAELARLLVDELKLRRPDVFRGCLEGRFASLRGLLGLVRFLPVGRKPLEVALVSELDTDYARAWSELLREASDGELEITSSVQYLRGIDGRMPGEEPGTPEREDGASAAGEGQPDYLRRLDRRLQGRDFDAIGILGSDVYDKVALLQVLRPKFPGALFFTTDVDARLLPGASSVHTLNLLIASHYGLILRDPDVPPLRSGYQAACFLATRRALEPALAPGEPWRHDPVPRMFEVGRTWIHQLESPASSVQSPTDPNPPAAELPRPWLFGGEKGRRERGVAVCVLLVAFVLLCARPWNPRPAASALWRALRPRRGESRKAVLDGLLDADRRSFLLALLAVVLVMLFVGLASLYGFMRDQTRASEPFFVVEGISAWPTVWIRIAAIVVAVIGYFRVWNAVQGMRATLKTRPIPLGKGDGETAVERAWSRFLRETGWVRVTVWSFATGTVYYLLTGALFGLLGGDVVPVRGERAFLIERFVLWLAVVTFVLLVFVVLRITSVATRFLRDLTAADDVAEWPGALRVHVEDTGLDVDTSASHVRVRIAQEIGGRVGPCIWWPATVLFLMVLSRTTLFDRWAWPVALLVTLSLSFVALLLTGHAVRRAARDLRRRSLEELGHLRLLRIDSPAVRDRIEAVAEELRGLRSGVFAPLWEHPLLRAWLLPLAALGANTSLEVWLPQLLAGA